MPSTPKLGIPYPVLADPADVPADTGELATQIDTVAGAPNGLATLGADGKVPTAQLPAAPGAIPPSIVDAKGDLIAASGADAVARLGVGTAGQILVVDAAAPLGVKWATPAAGSIPGSIFDSKGDLIGATAADTPARLPAGVDGQVLIVDGAQATGLKWGAPAAGSGVPNAIVDAKGDLIGASAPDTPARVPVGSNGQVLVADSAQALGVKWAAAPSGIPDPTGHEGEWLKVSGGAAVWAPAYYVPQAGVTPAATVIYESRKLAGDTQPATRVYGDGKIEMGAGGSTAPDVNLYRPGADLLATDDRFVIIRANDLDMAITTQKVGDAQNKWRAYANGRLEWGPGNAATDVAMYRSAQDRLLLEDKLDPGSLNLQTKAGVPVDGDAISGAQDGDVIVDTTNSRLYVRVGGTWKYAGLNGGGASLELAYAEITAAASLTATTVATAQTVITAPAITADGSAIFIEFVCPIVQAPGTNGTQLSLALFEDGTVVATIVRMVSTAASGVSMPVHTGTRRIPAAGSRTYSIRGWVSSGTGTINAGVGGADVFQASFIRVRKMA